MRLALVVTLVVAMLTGLGCARHEISREEWLRMSAEEKRLTVESLKGAEKAAAAKGETRRAYPREAAAYAAEIDARYAAGETRTVNEVWRDLGE